MKLYELTERWNNLEQLCDNEEVDKKILEAALNEIGEQADEKIENIAKVIKTLVLEAKSIKEEEDRLSKRRKALEKNIANLKEYVASNLIARGKEKVKTKLFTLYFTKRKSLHIDEDVIEDKYIKMIRSIDKDKIKSDLVEGKEVPGANYAESRSLVIR